MSDDQSDLNCRRHASKADKNSGELRHGWVLSTLLTGPLLPLIFADPCRGCLLVALNLATDDKALPGGGDKKRCASSDHDGKERKLFGAVAEVTLHTVVAEKKRPQPAAMLCPSTWTV